MNGDQRLARLAAVGIGISRRQSEGALHHLHRLLVARRFKGFERPLTDRQAPVAVEATGNVTLLRAYPNNG